MASSTRSSGARPVVAASSWRRDSVSGLRLTTITVNLETRLGTVKAINSTVGGWHRLYSGVAHRLRFSFLQTAGYSPPSLVFLFTTHYSLFTTHCLSAPRLLRRLQLQFALV